MHTDELNSIPQSAAVGMHQGSQSSPLVAQDKIIDAVGALLENVGWSRTAVYATGTVSYPLSFPVTPGVTHLPKTDVTCTARFLYLDGTNYSWYDPYTSNPSSPTPTCHMFALAITPAGGLDNLVAAINTSGKWLASWSLHSTVYVVTITALVGGAAPNYTTLIADGAFGVNGDIDGGGWQCTSQEERESGGSLRTGQYTVKITSSGNLNGAHLTRPIHFDVTTPYNSVAERYTIDSATYSTFDFSHGATSFGTNGRGYTMVANPYSFAVYVPEDATFTSIFIASPYIPTEESFQSAYCVFVVSAFTATTGPWGYAACALDGALQGISSDDARPRCMSLRKAGTQPLRTPSGAALISNAWVMLGRNYLDVATVVGRLWDCAILHDLPGTGAMIGGKQYTTLASQTGDAGGTRSALMFRTEN
jgi:hypothetical protein